MYRMTVVYEHPAEPKRFLQHYRDVHAPLVAKLPNLLAFEWGVYEFPDGSMPDHFLIAVLDWETKEDALAALATPAGREANADVANFASPGTVHIGFTEVEKVV
ncbi:uncharacterized protein (TIGR02118 family) [Amycolatopsis bartoniae]|uniref:Putative ethyl tert-butyl ether degradation protein EthD n=1 Tax=Amycolatopsis bartoniae TaxID=941986 RepID=A0A8H9ISN3_9PSEU|nr:EthD family reductase [Amycolatopsis bartoniae]MBB2938142.1 uncharacterized protein (TIGR02118 family) [Amycolatopsis bartoniae]TVT03251.1 EthD family reductase [Amycolatopsis bartoniae]GHF32967.1 putative ethyl tert-butyl ether degradation protein EthD [Amycolatopsis bartoniae]